MRKKLDPDSLTSNALDAFNKAIDDLDRAASLYRDRQDFHEDFAARHAADANEAEQQGRRAQSVANRLRGLIGESA